MSTRRTGRRNVRVVIAGVGLVFMASCSGGNGKPDVAAAPPSTSVPGAGQASTTAAHSSVTEGATPTTAAPTGGPTTSPSPATGQTQPTSAATTPPPNPQVIGDQAALILAYLRSNFADATWLGSVQQIELRDGEALLPTKISPDGRGETIARQICNAVLGNDRVALSVVTIGGAGGSAAATCRR